MTLGSFGNLASDGPSPRPRLCGRLELNVVRVKYGRGSRRRMLRIAHGSLQAGLHASNVVGHVLSTPFAAGFGAASR